MDVPLWGDLFWIFFKKEVKEGFDRKRQKACNQLKIIRLNNKKYLNRITPLIAAYIKEKQDCFYTH
ncbi:hypothetical protein CRP01_29225 [Flavilitoribacter nigricans DSM 23189 = NBRC 102662]|uniref:Uncharacterized protein n=1 Tax=Flavilitoribacter nigricans (strain ATCC 23147 / DSM 23189 / NBRC 102662 / NCIMB 1420 / SS-2) TaxID=1122177 RepID=A0A2D0N2X2_FLAN2|nr:hypothetical protein CRP01_29225 [Flavilitoribacter nigricans DSM 23189 = NBRC 102662]